MAPPAKSWLGQLPEISDGEFKLLQSLILRETGIFLGESKKTLLARRLAGRLRELGLKSFTSYYRRLKGEAGKAERVVLFDRITTGETHFFREPKQFEFLRETVVPAWLSAAAERRRGRRVRAWCAACATGEEPFTLAMILLEALPAIEGWDVHVLGTDISTEALATARSATWPLQRAEEIPPEYRKAFMLRGRRSQQGRIRARRRLRSVVSFKRLNLNDPVYPLPSDYDLILCRNALIYFEKEAKLRVVKRLLQHLSSSGYLFVGHAESLTALAAEVRAVVPTVYQKTGVPAAPPPGGSAI